MSMLFLFYYLLFFFLFVIFVKIFFLIKNRIGLSYLLIINGKNLNTVFLIL